MNEKTYKKLKDNVPGSLTGVNVQNGDLNRALRKWKKCLKDSNVIAELFERKEFTKPSKRRRKQLSEAKFKQKKETGN